MICVDLDMKMIDCIFCKYLIELFTGNGQVARCWDLTGRMRLWDFRHFQLWCFLEGKWRVVLCQRVLLSFCQNVCIMYWTFLVEKISFDVPFDGVDMVIWLIAGFWVILVMML